MENIVDNEYSIMEEKFTIDGEEEIIPVKDLDEYAGQSELGMVTSLYEEDENSLLDELTLNINKRDINRMIEKELDKLPVFERIIMEF